jgi:hypothetical protein
MVSKRRAIVLVPLLLSCGHAPQSTSADSGADCRPPQEGVSCLPPKTGPCSETGQEYDPMFDPEAVGCCEGLSPAALNVVPTTECEGGPCVPEGMNPRCTESDPTFPAQVCIDCGDGICAPYENSCTCPEDCPWPDGGAVVDARVPD